MIENDTTETKGSEAAQVKAACCGWLMRVSIRIVNDPLIRRYRCGHDWEFRGFKYRMNYWEMPSRCERRAEEYWCRRCGESRIRKIPKNGSSRKME